MKHTTTRKRVLLNIGIFCISIGIIIASAMIIWLASIRVPDFKAFEDRKIEKSTKIYDRTGKMLLYDLHQNVKRTIIPFNEMGSYIKNATIAIEDSEFYQHKGIKLRSFFRAVFANLKTGSFSQGGSTITQQIVKNTLLTNEKTITRKLKEWILAIKIERVLSKEQILETYLNENPYGGSVYGIEEASGTYFNKKAFDLTLAEAAYLAAIPKAPTFYSPYGKNRNKLDERKDLVLDRMHELKFITDDEYTNAKKEQVTFTGKPEENTGIKAPHFVFFVKDYLEQKYGVDAVEQGGMKVTTTLDYDMQQKAEEIVKRKALANEKAYKAENGGMVAIDPKTGQILVMVGSRDYFDTEIDGNYNIATAKRQPGSSFKPFVYAAGFMKGYTPDTVLFDVATEFNPSCSVYGVAMHGVSQKSCYMPENYTGLHYGPMTIRNALAQSINIPAVKMLYLVGIQDAVKVAEDMGITMLIHPDSYGLPLVLGVGEVRLVDMTSAYGVFATGGIRHPETGILKIEDTAGTVLEEYQDNPGTQVIDKRAALEITDILSDNVARTPIFGANSSLYFPGRDVAVKTGTTNDFKDAWIVGYTPSLAVGAWVGNNDNTPMKEYSSAILSAPMWREFMQYALAKTPDESFERIEKEDNYESIKPVLRGKWQGGESYTIDSISGKLATNETPKETRVEYVVTNVHDILYWINKNDPRGPQPTNPANDPQFSHWEIPVQNWWAANAYRYNTVDISQKPTEYDTVHTIENKPTLQIISPTDTTHYNPNDTITAQVSVAGVNPIKKVDYFLNDTYLGSQESAPFSFSWKPSDSGNTLSERNELKAIAYDTAYNSNQATVTVYVNQ